MKILKQNVILISLSIITVLFAEENWQYKLSNKTLFENEIDGHYCQKLTIDGHFIGWVTGFYEVGSSLVFRICTYEGSEQNGSFIGGVDSGWYELTKNRNFKPKKLTLPNLMDFSNPAYYKSYIAYWGILNDTSFYAMVYDLDKRTLVNKKFIGNSDLQTDYMYILDPPCWSKDGSSVLFKDNHFKQKILFRF